MPPALFDYQLDRHCSKTFVYRYDLSKEFDYQLDRHCSKTEWTLLTEGAGLITS